MKKTTLTVLLTAVLLNVLAGCSDDVAIARYAAATNQTLTLATEKDALENQESYKLLMPKYIGEVAKLKIGWAQEAARNIAGGTNLAKVETCNKDIALELNYLKATLTYREKEWAAITTNPKAYKLIIRDDKFTASLVTKDTILGQPISVEKTRLDLEIDQLRQLEQKLTLGQKTQLSAALASVN